MGLFSPMNKTVVIVALVMAIAGLVGWHMYLENMRYELVGTQIGVAYEVDRKTGTTWMVKLDKKTVHEEPYSKDANSRLIQLSKADIGKLKGNASLDYGFFSGKLYNGSDWIVHEVVFYVVAKEENGATRWARRFREKVRIPPLTTEDFQIRVTGEEEIGSFNWKILEVYGEPSK